MIYFGKLLPLNYCYLDWLVVQLRPIRKQPVLPWGLNSDYIKSEVFVDSKILVMLLQFVNYAENLDFEIDHLGDTQYRKFVFKLRDFAEFQDPTLTSYNYYQLKKMRDFFEELQTGLFLTSFSSNYYQRLTAIPKVEFDKCPEQKFWRGKICIVEELFSYNHPFCLPDFFRQKLTKDEFEVRFKVLQVFSSITIEKEFHIKEYLDNYSSVLNNQRRTNIKRSFLELIQMLEKFGLIESKYQIISDGRYYSTNELTLQNISQGFVIYEKLDF